MALRAVMFGALLATSAVYAERVKDLASIGGVRNNQLVGYGLVVGLDGTGDQTGQAPYTAQSIKNHDLKISQPVFSTETKSNESSTSDSCHGIPM